MALPTLTAIAGVMLPASGMATYEHNVNLFDENDAQIGSHYYRNINSVVGHDLYDHYRLPQSLRWSFIRFRSKLGDGQFKSRNIWQGFQDFREFDSWCKEDIDGITVKQVFERESDNCASDSSRCISHEFPACQDTVMFAWNNVSQSKVQKTWTK